MSGIRNGDQRGAPRDVIARGYDARNHKGTLIHNADVSSAGEPSSIHPEHTNGSKIRNKEKSLQSAGASCAVDTRIRTLQLPPRTSQPHHTNDMPTISRSAAPAVALRFWSPRIKMKGRKSDGRKAHRPPLHVLSITSFPPLSSPPCPGRLSSRTAARAKAQSILRRRPTDGDP